MMKMEQAKFLCPWRTIKTTEIEKGICGVDIKKKERVDFDICLRKLCPFYDISFDKCNRAKKKVKGR